MNGIALGPLAGGHVYVATSVLLHRTRPQRRVPWIIFLLVATGPCVSATTPIATGVFDVEAQPPLEVKGLDQGVVTYLVQRAKPRAFRVATRGIEGVETRMIGRDVELKA